MAPSRYDWKIVDWDVKPQHNQPTNYFSFTLFSKLILFYEVKMDFLICYILQRCDRITAVQDKLYQIWE